VMFRFEINLSAQSSSLSVSMKDVAWIGSQWQRQLS
jgi:hypothetical protein